MTTVTRTRLEVMGEVARLRRQLDAIDTEGYTAWDEQMVLGAGYDRNDVAYRECALALEAEQRELARLRGAQ